MCGVIEAEAEREICPKPDVLENLRTTVSETKGTMQREIYDDEDHVNSGEKQIVERTKILRQSDFKVSYS